MGRKNRRQRESTPPETHVSDENDAGKTTGMSVRGHWTAGATPEWEGYVYAPDLTSAMSPVSGSISYPSTTTGPITVPAGGLTIGTPSKSRPDTVDLPPHMTKKVLVAFLDAEDDSLWAKKLKADTVEIYLDDDGEAHMTLRLSLADWYQNGSK